MLFRLNPYLSIKRRINRVLRIILRKKEVKVHGVTVPLDLVTDRLALKLIDRRTYEGEEAALVNHYVARGSTVIELGASLGIISSVIGQLAPVRLLCVEALPELVAVAQRMLARNCPAVRYKVIQCAIAPTDGTIPFECAQGGSLTGKVVNSLANKRAIELPARRLSTLLAQEGVDDPFYLVCDIEGMEVALFLDDAVAFARCAGLVLESHSTEYQGRKFSPDEIFRLCESLGFELVERRKNVGYLKRIVI